VKTCWRGKFFVAILLRTARFARFFVKKIKTSLFNTKNFYVTFFRALRRFYQNKISLQANGTFSTLNKNSHFIAKLQAHTIRLAASAGKNFENLVIIVAYTHLPKYNFCKCSKLF